MLANPNVIGTPGVLRRLATLVYDSFLIFACCLVTGGIVVGGKIATMSATDIEFMRSHGQRAINGPIESAILFTVCLMTVFYFYAYFWRKTGQTLAMQAWRTRLISTRGNAKPTWSQCIVRFVVGFFAFSLAGLGFLWIYTNSERKSWQDLASGTELQLLEKKK